MLPSSIGVYNSVTWEGANPGQEISINYNSVDYDFLDTYGINLVSGRGFSPLIAWPLAYLAMKHWLNNFAYRIDLNTQWGFFVLAGLMTLVIALLAVFHQALKAALSDPVKTITYE
jgi:ABC-type lipoprotein release transport system permease subunit